MVRLGLFLPVPDICRVSSATEFDNFAGFQAVCQCPLDGNLTDVRALGRDFTFGDLVKIAVRSYLGAQHIGNKGRIAIVSSCQL